MSEKTKEKAEKTQIEGIIKNDKVIIYDTEGIEEFYKTSFIGSIEKDEKSQEFLVLEPIEVLLLCERNRILLYESNNEKNS